MALPWVMMTSPSSSPFPSQQSSSTQRHPARRIWKNVSEMIFYQKHCGKIGVLPDGLWHISIKVSSTNFWANINRWSLTHPKLVLKVQHQDDASCCWVCHGRFHIILPKEHSRTFCEFPWGLYKGMPTNTQVQSDIVTHKTNIWNKVNLCKQAFFYNIFVNLISTSKRLFLSTPRSLSWSFLIIFCK